MIKEIIFDLINYNKPRDDISNIILNLNKEKEVLNIKKIFYKGEQKFNKS